MNKNTILLFSLLTTFFGTIQANVVYYDPTTGVYRVDKYGDNKMKCDNKNKTFQFKKNKVNETYRYKDIK